MKDVALTSGKFMQDLMRLDLLTYDFGEDTRS